MSEPLSQDAVRAANLLIKDAIRDGTTETLVNTVIELSVQSGNFNKEIITAICALAICAFEDMGSDID